MKKDVQITARRRLQLSAKMITPVAALLSGLGEGGKYFYRLVIKVLKTEVQFCGNIRTFTIEPGVVVPAVVTTGALAVVATTGKAYMLCH